MYTQMRLEMHQSEGDAELAIQLMPIIQLSSIQLSSAGRESMGKLHFIFLTCTSETMAKKLLKLLSIFLKTVFLNSPLCA